MADDPPTGETVDIADPAAEASPFAALEPSPEGAPAPVVTGAANGLAAGRLDLVFDVPVCLSVELGRTEVPIRDVVNLGRGSIIELDRGPGAPLDVRVNGVLIGRGEVVLVNSERLGLRFVEVVSQAERVKRLD
ncbi:MAG TPA: flagellar motor switch protein FliN [Stellaceae bacterium]|jgi:flagellar motor switch protein FliN/FliY|nr:flagellar motor switch protein FliN [Stellaceae bacterium]